MLCHPLVTYDFLSDKGVWSSLLAVAPAHRAPGGPRGQTRQAARWRASALWAYGRDLLLHRKARRLEVNREETNSFWRVGTFISAQENDDA